MTLAEFITEEGQSLRHFKTFMSKRLPTGLVVTQEGWTVVYREWSDLHEEGAELKIIDKKLKKLIGGWYTIPGE